MQEFSPSLDGLTPEQQLLMLRNFTKRTDLLHEAQVQHLRLWPFAVDPGLTRAEAEVDIEGKKVNYQWEAVNRGTQPHTKPNNKSYLDRLNRLSESVQFLLGNDWTMKITLGETVIFPLKVANVRPKRASRKRKPRSRR